MRFIEDKLVQQWDDGSIPKKAKGELMRKFHRHFGFMDNSNTFGELMRKKQQPTPDQLQYLTEKVGEYWNFYNTVTDQTSV